MLASQPLNLDSSTLVRYQSRAHRVLTSHHVVQRSNLSPHVAQDFPTANCRPNRTTEWGSPCPVRVSPFVRLSLAREFERLLPGSTLGNGMRASVISRTVRRKIVFSKFLFRCLFNRCYGSILEIGYCNWPVLGSVLVYSGGHNRGTRCRSVLAAAVLDVYMLGDDYVGSMEWTCVNMDKKC